MALYCGIDLHSRVCWIAILNEELKVIRLTKVDNDLEAILRVLESYCEELEGIAVESTFNWYWLADGLQAEGYRVHLTNTCAVKQYDGLKYADDKHDARWLARLLVLGILPEGYIHPRQGRAVRDLLRRRSFLVRKRTSMLLAMRGAFTCRTGLTTTTNDVKKWTEADVEPYLDDPVEVLGITCMIEPINALNVQIKRLEKEVLARARLREEFALLQTVWGIGRILSLAVMYEVGDIGRFARVGKFASYCRLVKTARLSVGKSKGSGNAKNGNPYLSWAFSEAAHFAIRHHDDAKRFYQRKKSKTNGIIAVRGLAHKLARASYYVMRDQVEFDPMKAFG
jgi:transposase